VARLASDMAVSSLPRWLVVVAVGGAGGAIAAKIPTAYAVGVIALLVVMTLFLWRSQPMVPFLLLVAAMQGGILLRVPLGDAPISTLMPLLGGWAVLAVLLDSRRGERTRGSLDSGGLLKPSLLAFGTVVALTAAAQAWRPGGRFLSPTELLTLAQLGVLVVLAAYLMSSPRRIVWVARVTIAAGAAVAIAGLAERFGLFSLGPAVAYSGGYSRISGFIEDPNFFSYQLLIALAFGVQPALAAKTLVSRTILWLALAVILGGIVSTYSAGALVGLAGILATTVVLQYRVSAKRALAALGLIAVLTLVVAVAAPPDYGETVSAKYTGITSGSFEEVGTKRGAHWEAAVREMSANPILGVGLSTEKTELAIAERYTLERWERAAAHNMYLSVGVGAGAAGLIAFLLVLMSCFAILWPAYSRAVRAGNAEALLAVGCLITVLVVIVAQGLQLDIQYDKYVWLAVGACLAIRSWPTGERDVS
jgi:hypothetical protein